VADHRRASGDGIGARQRGHPFLQPTSEVKVRIGLVIDSVCDLPESFIAEHNIEVMPIEIRIGGLTFFDRKDPEVTAAFYRDRLMKRGHGDTAPVPVEQIRKTFLERLVLQYDFVFFLTTASSRSKIYENALAASFSIIAEYKAVRSAAGVPGPFVMRVIDTEVIVGAQAISAMEAARLIREGATPNQIEAHLNQLIPRVYGYMVPSDLHHVRESSMHRGEAAIGWFQYAAARLLDIKPVLSINRNHARPVAAIRKFENANSRLFQFGIKRIKAGLFVPMIGVGYSGDIADLEKIPDYHELKAEAQRAGLRFVTLQMGVIAGLYLGENVVGMAFAAEAHDFE
jgi:DegV family protein with EDD domain